MCRLIGIGIGIGIGIPENHCTKIKMFGFEIGVFLCISTCWVQYHQANERLALVWGMQWHVIFGVYSFNLCVILFGGGVVTPVNWYRQHYPDVCKW